MMVETGIESEKFQTLLEKFRTETHLSDSLERFRQKAWNHFLSLGLPSRKNEAYRHIKLRSLFSQQFQPATQSSFSSEEILKQITSSIYPECRQSVLIFLNGHYSPQLSNLEGLSKKIAVSPLQEAMQTYGTFLNNHWTKNLKEEKDPFAALNGALHSQGAFLYFPPKCIVETPIQILHLVHQTGGEDQKKITPMLNPRLQVFVGPHSQVSLIQSQKNLNDNSYFVNQLSEFVIDEGAHLQLTQNLIEEAPNVWHFEALRATLKQNSTLKTICITTGSETIRNDYHVVLAGENGEAELNHVSLLSVKRQAHTHVFIDHQAPHCRSHQLFKTVLNDFSRSSFEGKIMVRQAAQKTEAFQLNNNLILSDHAHADSKPNLEIFADDVKASHGATVGQLDVDQLFYMKTRGISSGAAKNLLIYGFCEQIIEKIPLLSLQEEIKTNVRHYLSKS